MSLTHGSSAIQIRQCDAKRSEGVRFVEEMKSL